MTDLDDALINCFQWVLRWLLFWLAVLLFGCVHQMGYCLLSAAAGIAGLIAMMLSFGIWFATWE